MTDPPDFDRLELMERGRGGGDDDDNNDNEHLFAGFAAFDESSDHIVLSGPAGTVDVDNYIDEEAPVSRSASYSPYGQISPKFLTFTDQLADQ
eukprot:CAMPEP_0185807880 /NCGR_PEP_ID=MMETSP1322-20130828/5284_1 /TAXON_ID=265543 /ORGANISM="Minutocellus polymorphus, Strain RCC2270" /LENGTH=92 /DNA_ID=CAMNT_0028504063 /DNA_START=8 /DNA_END=283 /DNA_ORIENTATION=+